MGTFVNAENIIKSVLKRSRNEEKASWEASLHEDLFSGFMNNSGLEVEVQPGVAVCQELFSNSGVKKKVRGVGKRRRGGVPRSSRTQKTSMICNRGREGEHTNIQKYLKNIPQKKITGVKM